MHHRTSRSLTSVLILFVSASFAVADDIDLLVRDLTSTDGETQARARQLLPRYGVEALPRLIPLLDHEGQHVWHTAYNVVADIANKSAQPGREDDRVVVTHLLMKLVGPDQNEHMTKLGFRLLPIVVPQGYDVGPVARYLGGPDRDLAEKARTTLEDIGTNEACVALLEALPDANAEFKCAILNSLSRMRNPESVEAALELTGHEDAAVRACAARAVAWTGDAALLSRLETVRANATPETVFDATDALLRLADAMAANGGKWELAMGVYTDVLQTAPEGLLQCAAVMGLGRYGDASVIDAIIETAKTADTVLARSSVQALASLEGREATRALVAAYPNLNETTQIGLLSALVRRNDSLVGELLQREIQNENPAFRLAALHGLAQADFAGALPTLVALVETGTDDERPIALRAAVRLANTATVKVNGAACLKLFALSEEEHVQLAALRGLTRSPIPEAFDVMKAALENPVLKDTALQGLVSLTGPLAAAGERDKVDEVVSIIRHLDAHPDTIIKLAEQLQKAGVSTDITEMLGILRNWHLIGPFEWKTDADWNTAFVGEPNIDVTQPITVGDSTLTWKSITVADALGIVNLSGEVGEAERCFAYAYTEIDVPNATDGQFRVGSDDGNAIWLNGERVWEKQADRGLTVDQDKPDVHFKQGRNTILIKISQGGGGWAFCARLVDAKGTGLVFTPVSE